MIIREKNKDTAKNQQLSGTLVAFRDGELTINLAEYEQDYPVHIDISEDEQGKLVTGPGYRYLAEIDIPARTY
jgi:hypothetical protein